MRENFGRINKQRSSRRTRTHFMCHECITNVLNTIYKYNFRLLFYPTLEIADIIKQNKEKTEETLYISKTILRTFPSLSKFQIDFTAG